MNAPEREGEDFQGQVERIRADVDDLVRGLDGAQLAWRPGPGRWGVGDCLAHLNVVGRWYVKQIDRSIADARARGLLSRAPFRLGLFARFLVRTVEPPVRRLRLKAPPGFDAGAGAPEAVVTEFHALQESLLERLSRAEGVDLGRARTRAPMSRRVHIALGTCIAMMLAHERRHLWQASQVRQEPAFPGAATP